jgi:hypothetical protein
MFKTFKPFNRCGEFAQLPRSARIAGAFQSSGFLDGIAGAVLGVQRQRELSGDWTIRRQPAALNESTAGLRADFMLATL